MRLCHAQAVNPSHALHISCTSCSPTHRGGAALFHSCTAPAAAIEKIFLFQGNKKGQHRKSGVAQTAGIKTPRPFPRGKPTRSVSYGRVSVMYS